jgi:hypothetical protein
MVAIGLGISTSDAHERLSMLEQTQNLQAGAKPSYSVICEIQADLSIVLKGLTIYFDGPVLPAKPDDMDDKTI